MYSEGSFSDKFDLFFYVYSVYVDIETTLRFSRFSSTLRTYVCRVSKYYQKCKNFIDFFSIITSECLCKIGEYNSLV